MASSKLSTPAPSAATVPSGMMRADTPEDRELVRKLLELGQLEELLADRELALASLGVDLRGFDLRYARAVGILLAELDQIEAEIAENWAKSPPRGRGGQGTGPAHPRTL